MIDVYSSIMTDAYPLAGVLLIIMASIFAILYMASVFFDARKLKGWIVNEAFQALATAVLLFIAVGLLNSTINLSAIFFSELAEQNNLTDVSEMIRTSMNSGQLSDTNMMFARAYLLTRLDRLNDIYDHLFYTYAETSTVDSAKINFPESRPVNVGLGFFGKVADLVRELVNYLYYGFLFVYFQLSLLELMKAFFFYAFPAGIVLRAFPFTRSVGSYLIASALALYFVYPFFLSLLLISDYSSLDVTQSEIINAVRSESPSTFLIYWVQQKLRHEEILGEDETATEISSLKTMLSAIQFILLTMTLYPFVSFVAAYTFLHQFSALMQANVSELGRGLLKLI